MTSQPAWPQYFSPSLVSTFEASLSPSAHRILTVAGNYARKRGNSHTVGTEHLFAALMSEPSRALSCITQKLSQSNNSPGLEEFLMRANRMIDNAVEYLPDGMVTPETPLCASQALQRVAAMANAIGSRGVTDGGKTIGKLVASEFLLFAAMVEGTGVLSVIFTQATGWGTVGLGDLAKELNIDAVVLCAQFHAPPPVGVHEFTVPEGAIPTISPSLPVPSLALPPLSSSTLEGPTTASNWLFPGRLLISSRPVDSAKVIRQLDEAGVTTYVCLQAEVRDVQTLRGGYPRHISRPTGVTFLWYPIQDFDVAATGELGQLVADVCRRVLRGDVVLIHCRGGLGRTGMVAIATVAVLAGIDTMAAREFVEGSTQRWRRDMGGWQVHMPETPAQLNALPEIVSEALKKRKR